MRPPQLSEKILKHPKPEYHPPEHQLRLFPEITGNELNGRGEEERRPPSPIYWHYGADIPLPHRALQDYYMQQFEDKPELHEFDKKYGGRGAREHDSGTSPKQLRGRYHSRTIACGVHQSL